MEAKRQILTKQKDSNKIETVSFNQKDTFKEDPVIIQSVHKLIKNQEDRDSKTIKPWTKNQVSMQNSLYEMKKDTS